MNEQENNQEQGFGKYILTRKIKEKFPTIFLPEQESDLTLCGTAVMLEGIHFSLVYFPLKHLGYKAVVSSIAEVISKKGKPEIISVNLGISSKFNVEDIESLIEGMEIACRNYDLKIADLNIDSSLTGLTLAVTSTGSADPVLYNDVSPTDTDIVCVTGDLGAAFMGLQLLERERRVFEETGGGQPQLKGFEYVIGRQMKPEIDSDAYFKIKEEDLKPTSVKILKEGLASDIIGLGRRYQLGCRLYNEKIPILNETGEAGGEFNIEPIIAALSGGDDFEYMFTFPIADFEKIVKIEKLSVVGHMTPENEAFTLSLQDNSLAELKAQGWEEG